MILFYDAVCPTPYSLDTLNTQGLGGSEATVVRLAEGLGADVIQHNRLENDGRYKAPGEKKQYKHVVCMRSPAHLEALAERYPKARLYLYLHDWSTQALGHYFPIIKKLKATIVCVSHTHRTHTQMVLAQFGELVSIPNIRVIYNPISDSLKPDNTPVDKNKLVFFSSPHKGLSHVLSLFKNYRSFAPDTTLFISNPGYIKDDKAMLVSHPNVVSLGVLSHGEAIKHVREALCVFYPQYAWSETFGLVFAEANAVGTPVLAHPSGAAHEILSSPEQLVNARNAKETIDKVLSWRDTRPIVLGRDCFRLSNILPVWKEMFNAT